MTAGSTAQQDREAHKNELQLMLFVSSPTEVLMSKDLSGLNAVSPIFVNFVFTCL